MRSKVKAAVAALAMLLPGMSTASAQEAAEAAPPAAAEGGALPSTPIPYSQIRPKAAKPKPRPAAAKATTPVAGAGAAAAPATAGAAAFNPGLPTTVAGARLTRGQAIPAVELEAFVDGVVRDALDQDHLAGAAVSVVQNGQVVLNKGYGFASLSPERRVDPSRTLFRIGSISKTFTWIALMKEVEAGRIRLNQPINLYLPERLQVRDQGYDQPVRVSHLLDHSAGFDNRVLGQLFERDFERVRPLDLYLRQERPSRVHAPGAVSSYSNYGAALAGEAVSYVTGKPFERLMEEEIFIPLGLQHTTFREARPAKRGLPAPMPQALVPDVAGGFRWSAGAFHKQPYEFIGQIAPAGSASSTAGDMARYMLLLLGDGSWNGVSLYGRQTAQAFRTPLRRTAPGVNGWAHGFATYDLPGGFRGFGHAGDTLAFHSNLVVIPALGLGVFVTTNSDAGSDLAGRLPDRIVRQFYAGPSIFPRAPSPELAERAGAFAGHYLTTGRAYHGLEAFVGRLNGAVDVRVTADGKLLTTRNGKTEAWVPEGPVDQGRFVSLMGDQRMAFEMRDGHAAALLPAANTALYERVSLLREPWTLAILAALTALAAVATLGGVVLRNRREFRENAIQSRASVVQNIQAGLWLAAMVAFGLWAAEAMADASKVVFDWPGALPIAASACALVAAALTAVTLIALPAIWRGGRRVDSWHPLRKVFFSLTVLVYAAFSVTLAMWNALLPWSG